MARPIRARMAPRNRNHQRSEQGKPTAGSSHSESALAIRSRTWQTRRIKKKRDSIFAYSAELSASTGSTFAGTVPPAPRIETSRNHGANLIKIWGRPAQLAAQNEKSREGRIRASAIFENGRLPQRDSEGRLR